MSNKFFVKFRPFDSVEITSLEETFHFVETTVDFVEAVFDFVERIVPLVAFYIFKKSKCAAY